LLQIIFGLILLSLYHPYLLFLILTVLTVVFIFKFSYKSGLETSLKESKFKYKVVVGCKKWHVIISVSKNDLNYNYGLQKNNNLVGDYLIYREKF
jgi:hypothetical protein